MEQVKHFIENYFHNTDRKETEVSFDFADFKITKLIEISEYVRGWCDTCDIGSYYIDSFVFICKKEKSQFLLILKGTDGDQLQSKELIDFFGELSLDTTFDQFKKCFTNFENDSIFIVEFMEEKNEKEI